MTVDIEMTHSTNCEKRYFVRFHNQHQSTKTSIKQKANAERGGEVVQFEPQLSSSWTRNNPSDILIRGIICRLVTGAGDKLPSQVQPYCVSTRVVVQEIRLVQNLKLLHFAPSIQIVFCIKNIL